MVHGPTLNVHVFVLRLTYITYAVWCYFSRIFYILSFSYSVTCDSYHDFVTWQMTHVTITSHQTPFLVSRIETKREKRKNKIEREFKRNLSPNFVSLTYIVL